MFGNNPISVIILKHASVLVPIFGITTPECMQVIVLKVALYSCSFENYMLITSWSSSLWIFIFLLHQLKRNKNKLWILSERTWLFRWFICQGNKCVQLQNYFICFQACAGMIKQQWKRGLVWTTKFLVLTCTKYQLPVVNWSLTIWTVIVFCHSHCQSERVCQNQWDVLDKVPRVLKRERILTETKCIVHSVSHHRQGNWGSEWLYCRKY